MEKLTNRHLTLGDLVYKDNDNNMVLGVATTSSSVNPYTTIADATTTGITAKEVSDSLGKSVDSLIVKISGGGELKVLTMDNITTVWYFSDSESVRVKAVISDVGNATGTVYIGY